MTTKEEKEAAGEAAAKKPKGRKRRSAAKPRPRPAAGAERKSRPKATAASATAAPPESSPPEEPLRVLFIHPAYPSQFTAIGEALNKTPGFECYGLVHNDMAAGVEASGAEMQHFGFQPDGQTTAYTYPYISPIEYAARNATGIASALTTICQTVRFDAIVGHAGFGSSIYLKGFLDCALISYAELPSFQTAAARLDFPPSLDTVLAGRTFESLIYTSILNSDLGVVPSEYAKGLYPPELQPKIRVQMEGFDAEHTPAGGPEERAALGLPAEGRLIGFFGRTLEAVRGFDIFIHVAERLHEADNSLRFLVIGEEQSIYGNEGRYIEGQSFKDFTVERSSLPGDAIVWRQTLPYGEFRRHIACLDLAILPLFEGAANWNLFEAMAVGLPILSSNRCFVPEVIRDGKEGILLDPYDVAAFVERASELLTNPERAKELGHAAKARIAERYSMTNAVEGYSAIIQEAISLHRGG